MVPPAPTRSDSRGDEALLQRWKEGDARAFGVLARRHDPALRRFARRHSADPAVASDAVQDTWLAVVAGIDAFEGRSGLRAWLYGILLNRLRTRLRRETRFVPFSTLPGFEVRDRRSSPEEALMAAEIDEVIERAIARLPRNQRAVLGLRVEEGLSTREVCDRLGITPANQRVLLHRARQGVRRALRRYREGPSAAPVSAATSPPSPASPPPRPSASRCPSGNCRALKGPKG